MAKMRVRILLALAVVAVLCGAVTIVFVRQAARERERAAVLPQSVDSRTNQC